MRFGLALDPRFRGHVPPGMHPERPSRVAAIEAVLAERGLTARTQPIEARPATRAELERVHDPLYLDALDRELAGAAAASRSGWLDPDTYFAPGSYEAALLAAGAAVDAAVAVARGDLDAAAAVVRPPGHHATRHRAMGFCLLNNAALAAATLAAEGLRVAVVDFDVHHGNGTQDIFWEDGRVLYASSHQAPPFYPGSGEVTERGVGRGAGATINVPLPSQTGDAGFLSAYDRVILPALARFRPDVLIASAGFDAHVDDPLAELRVTNAGFAQLAQRLRDVAAGKVVMVLEGGYDLAGLASSFADVMAVLLGDRPQDLAEGALAGPLPDAERRAIETAARLLAELPPPSPKP